MKRFIKPMAVFSVIAVVFLLSMGTTTTRTASPATINGVKHFAFTAAELAAATDSIVFSFGNYAPEFNKDTVYLTLRVQSENGDSVDLSVRWESRWVSTSDWESFTVGTDSTTWVSTTTTTFKEITQRIPLATNGGIKPFNRVLVFGNTGNLAGTTVGAYVSGFD